MDPEARAHVLRIVSRFFGVALFIAIILMWGADAVLVAAFVAGLTMLLGSLHLIRYRLSQRQIVSGFLMLAFAWTVGRISPELLAIIILLTIPLAFVWFSRWILGLLMIARLPSKLRKRADELGNERLTTGSILSIPASIKAGADELTRLGFDYHGSIDVGDGAEAFVFFRQGDRVIVELLPPVKPLPPVAAVSTRFSGDCGVLTTSSEGWFPTRGDQLRQVFPKAALTQLLDRHVATLELLTNLGLEIDLIDSGEAMNRYCASLSESLLLLAKLGFRELVSGAQRILKNEHMDVGPISEDPARLQLATRMARAGY